MQVVGVPVLTDFALRHAEAGARLAAWLVEADAAEWKSPSDVKTRYPSASFLAGNRVVFNIGGNAYRLVAQISCEAGVVLIERVGNHAEYSRWRLR